MFEAALLWVNSRGNSYLTSSQLILHICLLWKFRFKEGHYSTAHFAQPLVQFICLGVIELYGLFLKLTLQAVTDTLLKDATSNLSYYNNFLSWYSRNKV